MNIRIIVAALAAACQPALADSMSADPVSASFARMFEHQPHAGQTVVGPSANERDPLEGLVFTMFQGQRPAPVAGPDAYGVQVAASFDRMLGHEAHADTLSRTAFLDEVDPLEAAIRALLPAKAILASHRWRRHAGRDGSNRSPSGWRQAARASA